MSARRGEVTLRFALEDELYVLYKLIEGAFSETELAAEDSFIGFLASNYWRTWYPMLGGSGVCEEIFARDGHECSTPVCFGKDPTWHHIVYRSHGGGHEPSNGTSPCWPCHGEGIHEGRIRVTGKAPDGLVWTFGRRPWMEVRGREKRLRP